VTLNDLERRNGRVVCVTSPNSIAFGAYYVKVVVDLLIVSRVSQSTPTEHDGRAVLFAVAELLVIIMTTRLFYQNCSHRECYSSFQPVLLRALPSTL